MTGDNALGLRVTFRRTPQGDFKRIGQMLSAGDGFLGDVTSVKSSDPTETHKPFEVDYQISQTKFADWSRKSLQLRLPLPAMGIPEIEDATDSPSKGLKLGSPLDVHVRATIELPAGYLPRAPVPVSITRDYANVLFQLFREWKYDCCAERYRVSPARNSSGSVARLQRVCAGGEGGRSADGFD